MSDQRKSAPRRYFVDDHGHRVMIGLSLEETREFEELDAQALSAKDIRLEAGNDHPGDARERGWCELYFKHETAWRLWIERSRAEQV
ncbi:hypothetical protein [Bradyrhizobium sp. 62]|uniref:hypothetical protein n=1 Tax=Bradyrhizobium sp. 62 TaxID=1043588 RepID=UPI001FFAAD0C|nr:hypothetical protein [Bradyrhizobium sp. 62]MCK1369457.1 hypothetical protein [Bradyrhizobium sp. 62]